MRIEKIGDAILYCADFYEIISSITEFDAILTDPPYGISLNTDISRFTHGPNSHGAKFRKSGIGTGRGKPILGDKKEFDPKFLLNLPGEKIIWGWNNFPDKLPRGACLVWLKRHDDSFGSFLSDAELAWFSRGHGVYCI